MGQGYMVRPAFLEALQDVYHGEQFGEAFFEALLPHAVDHEQRYILGSLLQLESEGKAIMRPVLTKLGLSSGRRSPGRDLWELKVPRC